MREELAIKVFFQVLYIEDGIHKFYDNLTLQII